MKKKKKNQKANDEVVTDFRALGKLKSKPAGWAGVGGRRGRLERIGRFTARNLERLRAETGAG